MNREALRHLKAGGRVCFKAGGAGGYELLPPEPKITTADLIEQGYIQPDGSRFPGKHPALGAPYGKIAPSPATPWPCPGEQAVPNDIYGPAALHMAQVEAQEAKRQKHEATKLALRMTKHAVLYQVLALLGWAAVVVMGVWA